MMNKPLFTVENAQVSMGEKTILSIAHLQIPQGVSCAIIGPNGAGKSTLLKCLLGQYPATIQTALGPLPDLLKQGKIAWVGQHESFQVSMSVLDYVLMGRYVHLSWYAKASAQEREQAARWLAYFGLTDLANKRLSRLSGGERQRAAIVRALVQETSILLLDEPNNHLDVRHQHQLMQALRQQSTQNGLSCIMVLHDLSLAANYVDYLILMRDGEVLAQGTREAVLNERLLREAYGWPIRPMVMDNGTWLFDSLADSC